MKKRLTTLATIAPYLIWMALMMLLPASAVTYAVRSACTFAALCVYFFAVKAAPSGGVRAFVTGLAAGVAVCLLWVLPEQWAWYRDWFVIGAADAPSEPSVYDPSVCGWPLTLVRLAGSAFVIAVAEELFFRDFLYRWLQKRDWTAVDRRVFDPGAFFWMTGLFALEHDRWFAGALAGAVYGLVYIRRGLASAILAHVVTNFLLGLYVIDRGAWGFW